MDQFDTIYDDGVKSGALDGGVAISFWNNLISIATVLGDKSDLIEFLFDKQVCYISGLKGKTPMEVANELNDTKTFELLADMAASGKFNLN